MLRYRADTTETRRYQWQIFSFTPNTKSLKAAQLRNLQVSIRNISLFIKEYLDSSVSLKPRDRVYTYLFHFITLLRKIEVGNEYL